MNASTSASEYSRALFAAKQSSSEMLAEATAQQQNILADTMKVHRHNKEHTLMNVRNTQVDDWSSKRNEKLYWERVAELLQPTPAPTPAGTEWMLDIGKGLSDTLDDISAPDLKYGESTSLVELDESQAG